ncbi:short chain enoyl-CoA hydratase [Tistlia consotensis]|uniref:Short chain enoyl-CoA hydratase n=1 Tax=Tistlia consotensis USBA 355 TaxID=560819 RepID=A0A1Y6BVA8_9PROT|nr:enoyl-CoA hydratase-related protein [Tistlia consotensis]SMF30349.1 short chain enoyl-CoA hydratase [Tistlia consotensis USBA 355]SNR90144.1 short chain enoyl-CoA hydratase [Tistlia consotensis]
MTDASQPVLSERIDEAVVLVRINRGEVRNALNTATRKALAEAFAACHDDESVRAIVLTGNEEAFAAGADLKEFMAAGAVDIARGRSEKYWKTIMATPQPIIAAVNGFALGGGMELAMMADIIVAGEGATFGQPEVRVGIMPGAGGTQRLTRAVGKYNAMRLCLTGKPIDAAEAYRIGLVSQLVPDAEVLATALDMARSLARLPPLALQATKEAILHSENTSLEAGLAMERRALQVLFASRDKNEGMTAFFEKRRPSFTGE